MGPRGPGPDLGRLAEQAGDDPLINPAQGLDVRRRGMFADLETDEKARTVVQAVIELIKGVGCEVVAEAVETVTQADILRAMGCHTVQGFVFAEPMYEAEYDAWTAGSDRGSRSVA